MVGTEAVQALALPETLLFDYPTTESLLDYLAEQLFHSEGWEGSTFGGFQSFQGSTELPAPGDSNVVVPSQGVGTGHDHVRSELEGSEIDRKLDEIDALLSRTDEDPL